MGLPWALCHDAAANWYFLGRCRQQCPEGAVSDVCFPEQCGTGHACAGASGSRGARQHAEYPGQEAAFQMALHDSGAMGLKACHDGLLRQLLWTSILDDKSRRFAQRGRIPFASLGKRSPDPFGCSRVPSGSMKPRSQAPQRRYPSSRGRRQGRRSTARSHRRSQTNQVAGSLRLHGGWRRQHRQPPRLRASPPIPIPGGLTPKARTRRDRVKLTRFRGHPILTYRGVRNAQVRPPYPTECAEHPSGVSADAAASS
jgi:hypothetical protein